MAISVYLCTHSVLRVAWDHWEGLNAWDWGCFSDTLQTLCFHFTADTFRTATEQISTTLIIWGQTPHTEPSLQRPWGKHVFIVGCTTMCLLKTRGPLGTTMWKLTPPSSPLGTLQCTRYRHTKIIELSLLSCSQGWPPTPSSPGIALNSHGPAPASPALDLQVCTPHHFPDLASEKQYQENLWNPGNPGNCQCPLNYRHNLCLCIELLHA